MRQENEIQTMFREHAKAKPQKALLARIDKLSDVLNSLEYKGLSKDDRKRLFENGKMAIAVDLLADLQTERERIGQQLQHVRERFERDYDASLPQHSFEIAKFERKFRACNDKEISKIVERYVADENSLPNDPNILDALSAELRTRKHEAEFSTVRDLAEKRNYNLPHLKTEEGLMLQQQLKLNADVVGGGIKVQFPEDEGVAAFSVDALCEGA